jgi:hypothetical protein
VQAIACGPGDAGAEAPPSGVMWAGDEARAVLLASRWLRTHQGAAIQVASSARGGGRVARGLAEFGAIEWWPTGLASRAPGWFERGRGTGTRAERYGEGSDGVAALNGAIAEPPPVGRARAPLWDGDYLLAPLPLGAPAAATLLRAFAPLSTSWSGLDLIVLAPADRAALALARKLGIGARVHFAGPATPRAERAWFASASALVFDAGRPVSAALVLRALACGAPLLPIQDGPVAAAIAEWIEREGSTAPASFGADALARILERGEAVERAIEQGRRIAARHEPEAMGAQWKPRSETPSRAA